MKFLLEYVTCCTSCSSGSGRNPPAEEEEETTTLVVSRDRRLGVRRRWRGAGVRAGGKWQPSLSSISEDNVVAEGHFAKASPPRRCNKKKAASTRRIRFRPLPRYDAGRNKMPTIMPVFSPAPFLM